MSISAHLSILLRGRTTIHTHTLNTSFEPRLNFFCAGAGVGCTAVPHHDHLHTAGTATKAVQICPPRLSPAAGVTRVRCRASSTCGDDSQHENGFEHRFEDANGVRENEWA